MGVARVKILIFQLLFYFKKWDKGLAYRELEALKTQLKACDDDRDSAHVLYLFLSIWIFSVATTSQSNIVEHRIALSRLNKL